MLTRPPPPIRLARIFLIWFLLLYLTIFYIDFYYFYKYNMVRKISFGQRSCL